MIIHRGAAAALLNWASLEEAKKLQASPHRSTAIVEGPLAHHMRRVAAARNAETGLQILGLSQVAARLAGGFSTPVTAELLEPAIRNALEEKGFSELEPSRELPGMTRAIARTLRKAWEADVDLLISH